MLAKLVQRRSWSEAENNIPIPFPPTEYTHLTEEEQGASGLPRCANLMAGQIREAGATSARSNSEERGSKSER